MTSFFNALPGAVAQGLIWGIMAIGVYITYKILDVSDLTVDGSFCTGGAVCAMLVTAGHNVWIAMLAGAFAGMLAGLVTGFFHTKCRHPFRHPDPTGPVVREPGHHGYEGQCFRKRQ